MKSVLAAASGGAADVLVKDGDVVTFGSMALVVAATPGHTPGCVTYVLDKAMAFTGDALFVRGCGRTDFQGVSSQRKSAFLSHCCQPAPPLQGSSANLYTSIYTKLFTLPDSCLVYPGHDYKGRTVTTIGEEKAHNPRLKVGTTPEAFDKIMAELGLPAPKKIEESVPANLRDGAPAPAA